MDDFILPRVLKVLPETKSFFLLGPRGAGKTTWAKENYPQAQYIDLHDNAIHSALAENPTKIAELINHNPQQKHVIIDEILRIPNLELFIKNLITDTEHSFTLISSNKFALEKKLPNLLALGIPVFKMHPFTAFELASRFDLEKSLQYGHLPFSVIENNPLNALHSYIYLFLRDDILHGNMGNELTVFSKFLELISLYQSCDAALPLINRIVTTSPTEASHYFALLDGLFFSYNLPYFNAPSSKKTKFYFFDVGIFKIVHAKKLLLCQEQIADISLETLFLQELRALNDYFSLGYELSYWAMSNGNTVNFIAKNSFKTLAFIIKDSPVLTSKHYDALTAFYNFYEDSNTKLYLIYSGDRRYTYNNIEVIPKFDAFKELPNFLVG